MPVEAHLGDTRVLDDGVDTHRADRLPGEELVGRPDYPPPRARWLTFCISPATRSVIAHVSAPSRLHTKLRQPNLDRRETPTLNEPSLFPLSP